jgi:CHAT domain-containing protein
MRAGREYLIQIEPHDFDAMAEVRDAQGAVLANSYHPERRSGTRRVVLSRLQSGPVTILITDRERDNHAGTATVRLYDLKGLAARPACLDVQKELAAADANYARSRALSTGSSDDGAREALVQAADGYRQVQAALSAPSDRSLRGQAELALAGAEYYDFADWNETVEAAQAASRDLIADAYQRAQADALTAAAWLEIGYSGPSKSSVEALHRARAETQRLVAFHLKRGERYDAALQLTNTGLSYYYEGLYAECATYASRAALLFGEIGQMRRKAQSWQNRALCLWGQGHLPEALLWFERARKQFRPEPYPLDYFSVVTNTAHADYALGHFDEALRLFNETLELARKLNSGRYQAESLYGNGVIYYSLGDRRQARWFLEQALELSVPGVDRRQRREILRALATVADEEGETNEAIGHDREALQLAVTPVARGHIRIQLAAHTADAKQFAAARALLDDILANEANSEPYLQAEALVERAVVLRELGKPGDALADLATASTHLQMLGSIAVEFKANLEEARAQRQLGNVQAALTAVDRALSETEAIRHQTADPELRSQLQAPLRAAYDLKIELLRTQYDNAPGNSGEANQLATSAFATADASRARTLGDVAALEYSPALRRALAPEFRRRELTYRDLAARRYALEQRLDRSAEDPGMQRLRSDIADLQHTADLVNTEIAAAAGSASGTRARNATEMDLPKIADDSALVSYWLGYENAYAWVVADSQLHWLRLPPPADVSQKALQYHRSLTRFGDETADVRLQDAAALSALIIAPLEAWLKDKKQWIVIPDGALDYVPFAALRAQDSFVASQHFIALAPAAWMLQIKVDPAVAPERLLLVADPVYQPDDPRLPPPDKSGHGALQVPAEPRPRNLQRLPFTSVEATRIAAQFKRSEVDELTGVNATRERVLALDWSRYRYIHIATHGIVDAETPALSALLLGSYDASGHPVEGAVRVADLSLMKLNAEVAIFSACETALGKHVPSEGLVGISSTVLARGAHAVIASLWPVSDEMSARLMTEVYQHLLRDSMSAPAALGNAMHSVLEKEPSADPALWAAFQVSVSALGVGAPVNHNPH